MRHQITGREYAASKYITLHVRREMELMDFLLEQMSGTSKNRVKDLLSGRAVTVDKQLVTRHDHPLKPGMIVMVSRHKRSSELIHKYVRIIYEDKHLVVVEKAPGILSMGVNPAQHSIKTVLDEYFKKRQFKCTAHVVHRLDRDTSGLMMYAKNTDVQQVLEENWHDMVYDRRYVAVLSGTMEREGGTIQSWLRDNKAFVTYSSPTDNGGKLAITHYHTLQTTGNLSLVEMRLETGRKNQIRVHMQDLGHPIVGDKKYGNGTDPIGRMALHAYRLFFHHPVTGETIRLETPFPKEFMRLFQDKQPS
ncbi:MAG: RluA family pseudouridine synthase [Bacteroidaceae bacterium]